MTWYPIAFLPPQYQNVSGDNYSGAVLKAYAEGTTDPIYMATSYQGTTKAYSFVLNSGGYPTSGGAVIIPHLQEDYKLALYPDQDSADADSGAIWTVDNIKIVEESGSAFVQSFSGDGTTTHFTLDQDLGDDENTLMIFTDKKFGEYVTNGEFDADSDWTKGTGWTIGSGVATATGAISTDLEQTAAMTLVEGHSYTLTYTVTRTAGSVTPSIGGTDGTSRATSGTYTETIIAGSTQDLVFSGSGFTGTVDDVSIHHTTSARREILRPDEFTLDGVDLDLNEAPASGTNNVIVFAPSLLFGALTTLASSSATAAASAEDSANLASLYATAAAAALATNFTTTTTLTVSDSPYVPTVGQDNTLFLLDTSGGSITINLSALSTYATDMHFGFLLTDATNSVTINRGSTDTINGSTSATLSALGKLNRLFGDASAGLWANIGGVATINNSDWLGTDLSVANGGTGASTATGARTNLDVYSTAETDSLAGRILQIIETIKTDTQSVAVTPGTNSAIGPTASITLTDSGNKVRISGNYHFSANGEQFIYATLYRDGSAVANYLGDAAGSRTRVSGLASTLNTTNRPATYAFEFFDEPGDTSSHTYEIYITGIFSNTVYLNRLATDTNSAIYPRSVSRICLEEISQ